jgi:hypothetical protein
LSPTGDSLNNQLLLQILEKQQENASTLGEIKQNVADLKEGRQELRESVKALELRVGAIETRDLKRASFFAGVLFSAQLIYNYVKRKMGW